MSRRLLELLQWGGLLAGAGAFAAAHVVGYGTVLAECNPANAQFGIGHDVWMASLLASSALVVVIAEAASIGVLLATRETSYEAEPPPSRIRFFAIAAATANVIFLAIVLLDLFGNLYNVPCRGA